MRSSVWLEGREALLVAYAARLERLVLRLSAWNWVRELRRDLPVLYEVRAKWPRVREVLAYIERRSAAGSVPIDRALRTTIARLCGMTEWVSGFAWAATDRDGPTGFDFAAALEWLVGALAPASAAMRTRCELDAALADVEEQMAQGLAILDSVLQRAASIRSMIDAERALFACLEQLEATVSPASVQQAHGLGAFSVEDRVGRFLRLLRGTHQVRRDVDRLVADAIAPLQAAPEERTALVAWLADGVPLPFGEGRAAALELARTLREPAHGNAGDLGTLAARVETGGDPLDQALLREAITGRLAARGEKTAAAMPPLYRSLRLPDDRQTPTLVELAARLNRG